jgi:RNA polymerase sigma-70 factor (ECF subfamily)
MDIALIERAKRGDRDALARLLSELAPLVHRFGLRMCRHQADAEDVLQDTLLSVADHLNEYEGRASLASWVFMLARTACARRRRGLKNRPHLPEEAAGEQSSLERNPEDAADQSELRAALERALASLSEDQREVLLLRDMEGLSAAEVAASLGISAEAVKSRLHRARANLRAALEARGEDIGAEPATRGKNANCPDVLRAFSQKLEGELASEDCAAMEQHVQSCPACSAACSTLRSALGLCRSQASGEVSADLRARMQALVQTVVARR